MNVGVNLIGKNVLTRQESSELDRKIRNFYASVSSEDWDKVFPPGCSFTEVVLYHVDYQLYCQFMGS